MFASLLDVFSEVELQARTWEHSRWRRSMVRVPRGQKLWALESLYIETRSYICRMRSRKTVSGKLKSVPRIVLGMWYKFRIKGIAKLPRRTICHRGSWHFQAIGSHQGMPVPRLHQSIDKRQTWWIRLLQWWCQVARRLTSTRSWHSFDRTCLLGTWEAMRCSLCLPKLEWMKSSSWLLAFDWWRTLLEGLELWSLICRYRTSSSSSFGGVHSWLYLWCDCHCWLPLYCVLHCLYCWE